MRTNYDEIAEQYGRSKEVRRAVDSDPASDPGPPSLELAVRTGYFDQIVVIEADRCVRTSSS